jgi:ribosomal protein L15E
MVVAGGDYVHFVVEYGGKIEKCRVTETALLNRARMSRKAAGHAQLIAIFVRHRVPRSNIWLSRSCSGRGHSDRGVVVTTEDLNS